MLFFKANWCSTCIALDRNILDQHDNIPQDLTILEVNYDDAVELKKKYNVTVQHTLVQVDAEGVMITKWLGSPDLAALVEGVQ